MKILEDYIKNQGRFLPGGILKVDSFLNHQIEPTVMVESGKEIAQRFQGSGVTKILTIEASGIAPAIMVSMQMGVPMVFAKKAKPNTMKEAYTTQVVSFTKGKNYDILISREYLTSSDKVLIVDDILAGGHSILGILELCKQAHAQVVGAAVLIEKEFQQGRLRIREQYPNLRVDSLSIVQSREITPIDCAFMQQAIDLSVENVKNGGGPFGAVIAKDGQLIATGVNRVTANNDPTAHAEVSAIRNACQKLGNFKLDGCVIYTSCEPCPMCLSALYWAGISKIYYGNTKQDAKVIDFDDQFIYDEIDKTVDNRSIPSIGMMRHEAQRAFQDWQNKQDKIEY